MIAKLSPYQCVCVIYMCAVQHQQPAAGKSGEQSSQGSVFSGTLLWVSWQIWRTVKPRQFTFGRASMGQCPPCNAAGHYAGQWPDPFPEYDKIAPGHLAITVSIYLGSTFSGDVMRSRFGVRFLASVYLHPNAAYNCCIMSVSYC